MMKDFNERRLHKSYKITIYIVAILMLVYIWSEQWVVGLSFTVIAVALYFYALNSEKKNDVEYKNYVKQLSYRVSKAGEEAFNEMPLGIILYDESFKIEWVNPYMYQFDDEESIIGASLNIYSDQLIPKIKEE